MGVESASSAPLLQLCCFHLSPHLVETPVPSSFVKRGLSQPRPQEVSAGLNRAVHIKGPTQRCPPALGVTVTRSVRA